MWNRVNSRRFQHLGRGRRFTAHATEMPGRFGTLHRFCKQAGIV
jgi:hypothetical protein